MLIPLRTDEPTRKSAIVTILIIALNIAAFAYQKLSHILHDRDLIHIYGAIPAQLIHGVDPPLPSYMPYLSLLTYMFMHAGFVHIIGNMLFLNTFGPNVEDTMGHLKFLFFYILCGLVSVLVYAIPNLISRSSYIPLVGASGAIAGVMGAHFRTLPRTRILCLFFILPVRLPAVVILFPWILLQFYNVIISEQSNVAWLAHIGGFIFGMLMARKFQKAWISRREYSSMDL